MKEAVQLALEHTKKDGVILAFGSLSYLKEKQIGCGLIYISIHRDVVLHRDHIISVSIKEEKTWIKRK